MAARILVVDDEVHIANIIKLTLEHEGFEALVANDGADGLRLAREEKPDLILLDLMLPSIDGYKVCRLLKFDDKYKHIPIVLLSAMGEAQDRELGRQVGADLYISKPFKPDELVENIRQLLGETSGLAE